MVYGHFNQPALNFEWFASSSYSGQRLKTLDQLYFIRLKLKLRSLSKPLISGDG
jgi:hypothetical protein